MLRLAISTCGTLMLPCAFLTLGDARVTAAGEGRPAVVRTAQGTASAPSVDILRIITALRRTGDDTIIEEGIARVLGVPLKQGGKNIDANGLAYSSDEFKRIIAVPSDRGREYVLMLIVLIAKDDEATYFLTTPAGRLEKAVLNTKDGSIRPISGDPVEKRFRDELRYWQEKLAP